MENECRCGAEMHEVGHDDINTTLYCHHCGRMKYDSLSGADWNEPEILKKAINIILDEQMKEGPDVYFIEIETDDGCSINIGERIAYENGLTRLRIISDDIAKLTHRKTKGDN